MAKYSILVQENKGKRISVYLREKIEKTNHLSSRVFSATNETEMEDLLRRKHISVLVVDKGPAGKLVDHLQGEEAQEKRLFFVLFRKAPNIHCCSQEFNSVKAVLTDSGDMPKEIADCVFEAIFHGCACSEAS